MAFFLTIQCAHALTVGEFEPLSALGQPFRGRVGFVLAPGESIDAKCVRVLGARVDSATDVPVLFGTTTSIESISERSYLVFNSVEFVAEPILRLTVEVQCEKTGNLTRQYMVLLDPPEKSPAAGAPPATAGMALPSDNVPAPPANAAEAALKPSAATAPAAVQPTQTPRVAVVPRVSSAPATAAPSPAAGNNAAAASPVKPGAARRRSAPRDVLRLDSNIDEPRSGFSIPGQACCMQLAQELAEREGTPVSEAERDQLRMEYAERMGQGDVLLRLLALRNQIQVLKDQLLAVESDSAAKQVRREREEQSARELWLTWGVLAAIALMVGAWLWRRSSRREPFNIGDTQLFDTGTHRQFVASTEQPDHTTDASAAALDTPPVSAGAVRSEEENRPPDASAVPGTPSIGQRSAAAAGLAFEPADVPALQPPNSEPELMFNLDGDLGEADRIVGASEEIAYERIDPGGNQQSASPEPAPEFPEVIDFDLNLSDEESTSTVVDVNLDAGPMQGLDLSLDALPQPATLLTEADRRRATVREKQYRDEYIATRFPEIGAGSILLDKPESVVEAARIMYQEDQDVSRSVGLLQLAWSMQPQHIQLWLSLFEIYWLEGMRAPYIDLARRFRDAFSSSDQQWPMIAKLGRELDSKNVLFRQDGDSEPQDSTPNWLNAQLDMMSHVLTREMRNQILEQCGVPVAMNES